MKKLLLLLVLVFGACAPIDPATDADETEELEVDGIKQSAWCFGFPYKVMNFPVNQGAWQGSGAGQNSSPIFWNNHCPSAGEEYSYVQDDGEINLLQTVGWAPNTCWTWKNAYNAGIVCNGQSFQCPANACLTEPVTWQLEATAPNNGINWGYSQWSSPSSTLSAAPGNHGIWPKVPTQCSTAVPTPQFNPNGSGGTSLTCKYPMPAYVLKQF